MADTRSMVKAALASKAGQAALNRRPIRFKDAKGNTQNIWRSSMMADAFQQALT